jgi:hypothetical protein
VAGEGEVPAAFRTAADREHVLDRTVGSLPGHEAVDLESQWRKHGLERVEHEALRGRDAGAGDEFLG